jgi:hypothetical protein
MHIYLDRCFVTIATKSYLSGKILLTDRNATIRSVLKVVYFLCTVWGIFLHSHTQPDPKQGIKKFLRHWPSTLVSSLTLQSLTSLINVTKHRKLKYGKWWAKKSSVRLSKLVWTKSDICKVSDGTRVVGKWLRNTLIPCFEAVCVWGWRNIPQTVRVFTWARNTQLLALIES